jgi:hypothetical protein
MRKIREGVTMTQEAEVTVESTEPEVAAEVTEQPQTEVEETPAEQPEEAAASDVEDPEPSKKARGVQRRINELVQDKKYLQERLANLERLVQNQTQPAAQPTATAEEAPKIENYGNLEEFISAKAAYEARKIVEGTLTERERKQQEAKQQEVYAEVNRKAAERMAEAQEKYEDFDEVMGSASELSDFMGQFIINVPDGMDIAYYLAKNPQESARISRLDPFNASIEMADIRAKIKAPVKKSSAPPPINPLKGKASATKDPSEMTDAEFAAWRKQQIKNRGNG